VLRALLSAGVLAAALSAGAGAADAPQTGAPGAAIPFKPAGEASSDWTQAFGALVVVAALAWVGLYALKRTRLLPAALRGARRIRVVETTRLDARVTLYLVVSEGRGFLLGRCGDSLVVLRDFEAPASPGAPGEAAA
jgi:flagellar biogenesis protein FliO